MNVFVYTVSDFSPGATECIRYLYSSLKLKNQTFDFAVISNRHNSDFDGKIIIDVNPSPYVGFLKYSKKIPSGYDHYLYLDSDILFYDTIESICKGFDFSLVLEKPATMAGKWWSSAFEEKEKEKLKQYTAINAGSFSFNDVSFLEKVRNIFHNRITLNHLLDAKLEQSSFNRAILEQGILEKRYLDFSNKIQLHAKPDTINRQKTIYHFCGYSGGMMTKRNRMEMTLQKLAS